MSTYNQIVQHLTRSQQIQTNSDEHEENIEKIPEKCKQDDHFVPQFQQKPRNFISFVKKTGASYA